MSMLLQEGHYAPVIHSKKDLFERFAGINNSFKIGCVRLVCILDENPVAPTFSLRAEKRIRCEEKGIRRVVHQNKMGNQSGHRNTLQMVIFQDDATGGST
jgi:hypothetical protein